MFCAFIVLLACLAWRWSAQVGSWLQPLLASGVGRDPASIEMTLKQLLPWALYIPVLVVPVTLYVSMPWLNTWKQSWTKQRHTSENFRREYFEQVISAASDPSHWDRWTLMLATEYFRRWQVELQQSYYKRGGPSQHGRAVRITNWLKGLYVVVVGVLGILLFLAQFASGSEQGYSEGGRWFPGEVLTIAAKAEQIGTDYLLLGSAFALFLVFSYYYMHNALNNAELNNRLYSEMATKFDQLAGDSMLKVRAVLDNPAASLDDCVDAVGAYVASVHSAMKGETKSWTQLS
jgi:hypothetical protein